MDMGDDYSPAEDHLAMEESMDLDDMPITQEDAWAAISAYFEEKGLVRQQLDSIDEFIQNAGVGGRFRGYSS